MTSLALGVVDAAGDRVGREAAEHHRVNRAETRAGEHRIGGFGDHRQIDGDAVALLDAMEMQDVGEAIHLVGELGVGDVAGLVGIVAFPDDRGLVGALGQMPVDAIIGDVGDAVLEPLDRHVVRVEARVLDLGVGREPVDPLAVFAPESVRVLYRAAVHLLVFGFVDPGALGPIGGDFINVVLHGLLPTHSCAPTEPTPASVEASLCLTRPCRTSRRPLLLWS